MIVKLSEKCKEEREEIYDKGFEYYSQPGISIQGSDARRTLREIINIVKIKNNEFIYFNV
jgi:hypothetical protein